MCCLKKNIFLIENKLDELNNFKKISLLNTILQNIYNDTKIKPYVIRNGKLWIEISNSNTTSPFLVLQNILETPIEKIEESKLIYLQKVFDAIYLSLIRSIEKNKCEIFLPENLVVL